MTSQTVPWRVINVSCQSETQKHLLHNISDANREVDNLTKRKVMLMLVCYLPLAAIHTTGLFLSITHGIKQLRHILN